MTSGQVGLLGSRSRWWNGVAVMPVVFIHYPYSNPHPPPQMGRVWVENNYPLKK
jgi:hypothetical protein